MDLRRRPPEAPDLIVACYLTLWGTVVLLPWTTITATLGVLTQLAPEPVWGLTALVIGLLYINALARPERPLHRVAIALAAMFWAWLVMAVALSNPHAALSIMTYSYMVVLSALNALHWTRKGP